MMSDAEIYAEYSRYAVTVAGIKPMRFETWAKKRDNLVPFRTWFENESNQEDGGYKRRDLRDPAITPREDCETEASLQRDTLALFQQIVSSPPLLALSDEIPVVDTMPELLHRAGLAAIEKADDPAVELLL